MFNVNIRPTIDPDRAAKERIKITTLMMRTLIREKPWAGVIFDSRSKDAFFECSCEMGFAIYPLFFKKIVQL